MQIQSGYFFFTQDVYPQLGDNDPPSDRRAQDFINFPTPFASVPTVAVSIVHLDVYNGTNTRIQISTDTVTDDGFELIARTWWDTLIYSVGVSWIAYGD